MAKIKIDMLELSTGLRFLIEDHVVKLLESVMIVNLGWCNHEWALKL